MDQLDHTLTVGPNPLRGIEEGRGRGQAGAWASGNERADCCSRRGHLALWPMSPAARLSDQDMNAALSDDPARSRPRPGLGIAERCASRSQGAEAKARGATLTFAERAFAGAGVEVSSSRAVELSNLEDLEAKTRGLWWGCGGWTTRS